VTSGTAATAAVSISIRAASSVARSTTAGRARPRSIRRSEMVCPACQSTRVDQDETYTVETFSGVQFMIARFVCLDCGTTFEKEEG
jgi:transposase-like protein